ncbi:MAG: retroviral-like aspartic protease [Candidatus Blackburnbacteria bacterium]|nr:retroviral-like aspartic protease [Candidatus Blackburnbacteria bacterium]
MLPGDPTKVLRPLVPVKYKYQGKETKPILTLIDSGADYSFATLKIALYLGIKFKGIKPVSITGFNQATTGCFPKEVGVEVAGREIQMPVYFGGSLTQEYPSILGQDIFFDKARITFERYNWSFGIYWQ